MGHVFRLAIASLVVTSCNRSDPPTCAAVGAHIEQLMDGDAEIGRTFTGRCTDDAWPAAARACLVATTSLLQPRNCKQHLTADQASKLDAALDAADEREQAAKLPDVCVQYTGLLDQIASCDALPPETRASLARNLADAKARWAAMPDQRAAAPECASALRAVRLAAAECPGVSR